MSKIEDHVLTREQMLHLQELGIDTSDAALSWVRFVRKCPKRTSKWQVRTITAAQLNSRNFPDLGHYEGVPTYTLQELLSKFPPKYHDRVIGKFTNGVTITYGEILEISRCTNADNKVFYDFHYGHNLFNGRSDKNPLLAAYKTLCWILEEKEEKK